MPRRLRINLSDSARMLVDVLEIKNSGKAVLIPFDFGLNLTLTTEDIIPFNRHCKKNPDAIYDLEKETTGLIVDHDDDYLSISLRRTEYLYIGSNSNYISVFSSLEPSNPSRVEPINIEGVKLHHLVSHDSCWRTDGLEQFDKMFASSLINAIQPCLNVCRAKISDLNLNFYGTGLEKIKKLEFTE